jgi:hypothetical protein
VHLIVIHSQIFSKIFLFALIAQLIFTRSLRKAPFPFLFIWNLVFKIDFGALSQKHLRNVARGSRSVVRAPQKVCVKCVSGTYLVSNTQLSLIFQSLTYVCVMCVRCVSFFKLFTKFFYLHVFFLKTNFNLNLLYTHYTHLYSPHGC